VSCELERKMHLKEKEKEDRVENKMDPKYIKE